MELKILCLLVIIGVLSAETKIMKADMMSKMQQINDKLLKGVPEVEQKLLRGMPQVNKEDPTTIDVSSYEWFVNFYRYNASSPSSSVAPSSINTCIATSRAAPTVTIGVYALRAARGTKFLRHHINEDCLGGCFRNYRFENLTVNTFESCADAVESSGWANSFSFLDDECVGYAAWMHSRHTEGSQCDGDFLVFVAENKINNFSNYTPPYVEPFPLLSRIFFVFVPVDMCLTTAKIEVTTILGTKTFDKVILRAPYLFEQYNSNLCSLNPPENSKMANITIYDHNGKVQWKETVQRLDGDFAGTVHRFSGAYGDLCVYQVNGTYEFSDSSPCGMAIRFEKTNILSFAEYRNIISTIPGLPSHFVRAIYLAGNRKWVWTNTKQPVEAEAFVSNTIPTPANGVACLIANSSQNYLLEPASCRTPRNMVCLDFSAIPSIMVFT